MEQQPIVKIENLSHRYSVQWAVKDIDLEIKTHGVYGLLGSNGAGKSTLLKVVSGVLKPTKGKVTVNGVISPMIELGAGFDMDLTARENIYLNGAILGYSKKFLDEKFDEMEKILLYNGYKNLREKWSNENWTRFVIETYEDTESYLDCHNGDLENAYNDMVYDC